MEMQLLQHQISVAVLDAFDEFQRLAVAHAPFFVADDVRHGAMMDAGTVMILQIGQLQLDADADMGFAVETPGRFLDHVELRPWRRYLRRHRWQGRVSISSGSLLLPLSAILLGSEPANSARYISL